MQSTPGYQCWERENARELELSILKLIGQKIKSLFLLAWAQHTSLLANSKACHRSISLDLKEKKYTNLTDLDMSSQATSVAS